MASLTIENVPDELLERLRESAERHRRSLDHEVIDRLRASVPTPQPVDPQEVLADLRAFRASLNVPLLTDEFLDWAINEGRE